MDCVEARRVKRKLRTSREKFLLAFIPLFVAIDPIGLVAIFIGLGTSASPEKRKASGFSWNFHRLAASPSVLFFSAKLFSLRSESRWPIFKSRAV